MSTMSRRNWLRHTAGLGAVSLSGWLGWLAARSADDPRRKRSCILLWMNGGPLQMDTFDLKPGHDNGGPFKEIQTAVPGLRISEHLPKLAAQARRLAVVRSMTSREGDHGRATFYARTGYFPQGPVQYPPRGRWSPRKPSALRRLARVREHRPAADLDTLGPGVRLPGARFCAAHRRRQSRKATGGAGSGPAVRPWPRPCRGPRRSASGAGRPSWWRTRTPPVRRTRRPLMGPYG